GRDGQGDGNQEGGGEPGTGSAPLAFAATGPGEEEADDRREVERGLPGQGREPPQDASRYRRAPPAGGVRGEHALEAPPQEDEEERLGPEVDREPDQLRIEGGGAGGKEARARRERRG